VDFRSAIVQEAYIMAAFDGFAWPLALVFSVPAFCAP
jgi:hypothetical protein